MVAYPRDSASAGAENLVGDGASGALLTEVRVGSGERRRGTRVLGRLLPQPLLIAHGSLRRLGSCGPSASGEEAYVADIGRFCRSCRPLGNAYHWLQCIQCTPPYQPVGFIESSTLELLYAGVSRPKHSSTAVQGPVASSGARSP